MTIVNFSKTLGNVALESFGYIKEDKNIHAVQLRALDALKEQPKRENCLLCAVRINDELTFLHRSIKYVRCKNCGHIQTQVVTPSGYPHEQSGDTNFDKIYPALEIDAYISRRKRIYEPKLEWALKHLRQLEPQIKHYSKIKWLELGSGAGYFLSALKENGIHDIVGIEKNVTLAEFSNDTIGDHTICYAGELADVLLEYPADIYVAFFVLEHIENPQQFWHVLEQLPKDTIFIFSVPMFGFATLLESAFVDYAARNLDNAVHTQLYSEESINFALKKSGYEKIAQWVFGQDSHDLMRLMLLKLENLYSKELLKEIQEKLLKILDPVQAVLDQNYLSDARHVIAIKR